MFTGLLGIDSGPDGPNRWEFIPDSLQKQEYRTPIWPVSFPERYPRARKWTKNEHRAPLIRLIVLPLLRFKYMKGVCQRGLPDFNAYKARGEKTYDSAQQW